MDPEQLHYLRRLLMSLLHPSSGRLGRARGPLADYSWPSAAKGAFLRSREIMSELWNARAAANAPSRMVLPARFRHRNFAATMRRGNRITRGKN